MSATTPGEVEEENDALIFHWRGRPRKVWRLLLTLLVSLLVHAAAFYLLQVAYTPTGSLQPPAAQVVLLAPENPAERAALNQWLKMADPALMTFPAIPPTQNVLDRINFRYVPSYAAAPPAFKSLEPAATETDATIPELTRKPGPIAVSAGDAAGLAGTPAVSIGAAAEALPTKLVFRGPIERLAPSSLPPLKFTAVRSGRPLEPTVYLVGVHAGGGTPSLFREPAAGDNTIGDATIDEAARDYLTHLVFQAPAGVDAKADATVWGWATFYWGREVYR